MSPRGLPSGVQTSWEGTAPTYVRLFELATGGDPIYLRWVRGLEAVTFASSVFSPRGVDADRQTFANQSKGGTFDVRVSDADGAFAALFAAGRDLQGQRLTIYRTTRASLGGAGTDAHKDVYVVDTYARRGLEVILTVKSRLALFNVTVPREVMTAERFPGMPSESA